MNTHVIDLDGISPEVFKELMGMVLTIGLNFRKLDKKSESGTGRALFVETLSKAEEKALNDFISSNGLNSPIVISENKDALKDDKKLGVFGLDESDLAMFVDKTTGKRFSIVGEK
jgi:hypothetical protein